MIDDLWYKNAVIYSLDLETFMDGNGDGCGDFEGLNSRLDYLDSLGIDTVWLAPFQPSPNRDNGYDIADFYGVDPRHGTSGEFVDFVQRANARGIRVIMDLVVNHTSDRHPWFQDARRGPEARHHDWYIWSKDRPANHDTGMVFPGVQKAVWTRDRQARAWYHHRFYRFQPDLNMDNPEVRAEIRRIMGYWLQLGVAGFRVDAVPFVIESGDHARPRLRFDYLAEMRQMIEWRAGNAVLLGEANVLPKDTLRYFGTRGEGVHMMFNFHVNQRLFLTLATGDARPLAKAIADTRGLPVAAQWANFLRNHDELDLGRLSPRDRERVFARYGPSKDMQLYDRGIRRRLAPMLGDRRQLELAHSLLFSLPGAQVIRYGDEIGMGENLALRERDAVRTPMQWADAPQAGFSTARRLVHPVIPRGPWGYRQVNVDAQRRDRGSLLNWMVELIRLRKECPEIGWGRVQVLPVAPTSVLALHYEWRGNRVVLLHNFADRPVEFALRLRDAPQLTDLVGTGGSRAGRSGSHRVALPALGYRWYRVGRLAYGSSPALTPMR